jgi:3-hydroxyisobutyrate dehydrogenase
MCHIAYMEKIAFYGTGLLGSAFVRAFLRRGIHVNVWNRTFSKAQALEEHGAKAFQRADDAARDATRVHLCLRDDASVDAALDAAVAGIRPGTLVVDHTTVAPSGIVARTLRMEAAGLTFVHAPVFMGPPNALEGSGAMVCSVRQTLYERVRPILEPMTGRLVHLGERADRAATFKLMGNASILAIIGIINDIFRIADANGITREDAYELFSFFNPASQISGRGKRMASGDYEPTWTLDMAHKDALLMIEAASGRALPIVNAVERELRRAEEAGLAHRDLGAIASLPPKLTNCELA